MSASKDTSGIKKEMVKGRGIFRFRRVLGGLLVVLILGLAGAVLLHRSLLSAYAPSILTQLQKEFEQFYELDLEYSGYRIDGLNDFTITGISITDIPTGTSLLEVDSMRIRTSLFSLAIRGQDPMLGVTSVELDHPSIILERKDGRWNTGTFFEPSEGEAYEYPGRLGIVIRDGVIEWRGGDITETFPFPAARISGLQGVFRLGSTGEMGLSLEGTFMSSGIEPGTIEVVGTYDPERYMMQFNIDGSSLDLTVLRDYAELNSIHDLRGTADTNTSILIGEGAGEYGYSILGQVTVNDVSLSYSTYDVEIYDVAGDLHYSGESVFTSGLGGRIDGSNVTVMGRVGDFTKEQPSFDLLIDASGLGVSTIENVIPQTAEVSLAGSINLRAEVISTGSGIEAVASMDSPVVSAYMFPFSVQNASGWYSDEKLVVNGVEVGLFGGMVTGGGVVDISGEEPEYEFRVAASELPLDQLASCAGEMQSSVPIQSGVINAGLAVSGTGTGFPQVSGLVEIADVRLPQYGSLSPLTLTLPVTTSGNAIRLSGASVTASGLTVLGEGEYDLNSGFRGNVAVTVDDRDLVGRISGIDITGLYAIAGDLNWSRGEGIEFEGEALITDVFYGTFSAPNVSCRFEYGRESVRLWDMNGLVNGGLLEGNLVIPLTSENTGIESGTFSLSGLNVGQLAPAAYTDTISTAIDIDGQLEYNQAENTLIVNMMINEGAAKLGPNTLSTDENGISLRLGIPFGDTGTPTLTCTGKIKSRLSNVPVYQGRVLTPFSSTVIREVTDLLSGQTRIMDQASIPSIAGEFDVRMELADLLGTISGSIGLAFGEVEIGGFSVESGHFNLDGEDGINWGVEVAVNARETGTFNITGSIQRAAVLADSTVDLAASISDSGINNLFGLIGLAEVGQNSGWINGYGSVEGTISHPVIDLFELGFGESQAFGIPLSQGIATFGLDFPMLNVTSLEIVGSDGFRALGAGSVDVSSVSLTSASLVLRVDSFNLNAVSSALGREIPIRGIASGTLQLAQDALGPKILYGASVIGFQYEDLDLGDVSLSAETRPDDPQLKIGHLDLVKGEDAINIAGFIPINFRDSGADLFNLTIDSPDGYSVAVPEGLVPLGLTWEGGLGPVHLALTGSVANTVLAGELNLDIRDVRIGENTFVNSISGPLTTENSIITGSPDDILITGPDWEIGVDTRIDLNTYKLWQASYTEGSGHIYTVGSVARLKFLQKSENPLVLTGLGYHLQMQPGLDDNAPVFQVRPQREGLEYTFDGDILLVGGAMDFARVTIGETEIDPEYESPFSFDLSLILESGFRVRYGNLINVTAEEADLELTGDLSHPVLTGSMTAPEGWIDLFGNHFTLVEPLAIRLSSLNPITDPHITATGRTYMRQSRSPGSYGEELVITARINSRLSQLLDNLQLTSVPPHSKDTLIAALAYEDFYVRTVSETLFGTGPMSSGFDDIGFGNTLLPIATGYLSQYIRNKAGFVDFEMSLDSDQNLLVYIEKEVFDNFVMYYSQSFGPDNEDDYLFGARYRWRPRSWVGVELDSNEEVIPRIEYIIPLD